MSDSLLKKEFSKSDVQRARNLIQGKYGDSTKLQVGYSGPAYEKHTEGDVWTDTSGKTWTIREGVRFPITKLNKARELTRTPLACPKCGKALNTRLDKKMYPIHGMCFDCVIKMEEQLREQGLYEAYEQSMIQGNLLGFATRIRDAVKELTEHPEMGVSTDEGSYENWGKLPKSFLDNLNDWVEFLSKTASDLKVTSGRTE